MNSELVRLNQEKQTIMVDLQKIKGKKLEIEEEIRKKKNHKPKEYSQVNKLIRVSINFDTKIGQINDQREENGFDRLSNPKITELIIRHKSWKFIEQDIIHFITEEEDKSDD